MADLNFETARDEVRHIVNASSTNLKPADILAKVTLVDDMRQLTRQLHALADDGSIERHPAPEGSGTGVKYVYGPGAASRTGRHRRMGGFMAAKRERDAKDAKHQGKRGGSKGAPKGAAADALPVTVPAAAPLPERCWALTNDGAFLLLGTQTEIRGTVARALVDFIRMLDGAQA